MRYIAAMSRKSAVLLLSGGLDSAVTGAIARADGYDIRAISFRYGQRHEIEIDAARAVAAQLQVSEHRIADIDLRVFGQSALTDDIPVPKDRVEAADEIPITYVPARNALFLCYAMAFAETSGATDIFIGVNAVDYSGYPDCRPAFIDAFQKMANLATRVGVEENAIRVHTPLMELTKRAIIERGLSLGVDFGLTRSCYDPDDRGRACGHCDSCRYRLAAFAELGRSDPAPYQDS